MYILVGMGFLLVIGSFLVIVWVIAVYNKLIHLHLTCKNTVKELCTLRMTKAGHFTEATIVSLLGACHKANTLEKQVLALNHLRAGIVEQKTAHGGQELMDEEHKLQTEKRFYNNTARELADRLATFPGKIVGPLFHIQTPLLLDLDEQAQDGILPEAKYM